MSLNVGGGGGGGGPGPPGPPGPPAPGGGLPLPLFGTGDDGDVTISSNTDLGSDNIKNYTNLTVDATFELKADGPFYILCSGTITNNGIIGVDNPAGPNAGGAGAQAGPPDNNGGDSGENGGSIFFSCNALVGTGVFDAKATAGQAGGTATVNPPNSDGVNGANETAFLGGDTEVGKDLENTFALFGQGGTRGRGVSQVGGPGASAPVGNWAADAGRWFIRSLAGTFKRYPTEVGGAGGGGGGGGGTGTGSRGASGGGGSGSSGRGLGGAGGNGKDSGNGAGVGGGGGGGGGAGGNIIGIILTGDIPACTFSADGGNGGAGGNGNGTTGCGGGGGGAGGGGLVDLYVADAATVTDNSTTSVLGGTGGAGGTGLVAGDAGGNGGVGAANVRTFL